jgi:hypothetical protein
LASPEQEIAKMLKLFIASTAMALTVALSGADTGGARDRENTQCASVDRGQTYVPMRLKAARAESNPEQESSKRLMENLCIIIRQR